MFDPKKKAVDWAVYRHGGKWRLFTLACLVHRLDPRAVLDDAYLAIRKHGGPSSEVLNDPKAAAAMLYDVPEMYLIEPVGATLERMKTATGLPDAGAIACEQARALADSLGLTFPAELMPTLRQQPAPQAEAPAVGMSGAPAWAVTRPQRYQGYASPLHRFLSAAHRDGKPRPSARDVIEEWRVRQPAEIAQVMPDGVNYYDSKGNTKAADLEAIRKSIDRMTSAR